jgi:hypothetical protein
MNIALEDVESLRFMLTHLPKQEPTRVTRQRAIALLASELNEARRRGYGPEELAHLLSENGLAVKATTLQAYLHRTSTDQRTAAKRRRAKTASGRTETAVAAATRHELGNLAGPPSTDKGANRVGTDGIRNGGHAT